ncbi:unnamed protein product [Ranitomeya imitator]|uniref:HRDC domain-containing protein n=1 Tax=Ranitomeya imitator TaxID=111125 RepID=A0ABN9LHN4_9NEOB|nr:unnamed protein product [Ranitomeya imitator]
MALASVDFPSDLSSMGDRLRETDFTGRNWMSKAKNQSCPSLMLTPSEELCPRKFAPSLQPRSPMVRQLLPDVGSKKPEASVEKISLRDKFSYDEPGKISKTSEIPSTSILRFISPRKQSKPPEPAVSPREMELQTILYGKLLAARQKIASEKDIPPAVLATNKVLVDMAKIRPTTIENMKQLDGVSEAKANMLAPLVEIVKEFCLANTLKAGSLNVSCPNLPTIVAVPKSSACLALPRVSSYYLLLVSRTAVVHGYIGGLSTAFQNAVDKPLMQGTLYCTLHGKQLRNHSGKNAAVPQKKTHCVNMA